MVCVVFLAEIPNPSFLSYRTSGDPKPEYLQICFCPLGWNHMRRSIFEYFDLPSMTRREFICKADMCSFISTQQSARTREYLVRALAVLCKCSEEAALRALLPMLDDPDSRCRQVAIDALIALAKVIQYSTSI
jgi:hypothetical protein